MGRAAEAAIRSKMAADCMAVRSQAAAALAALAAAQPPCAAQLLADCLEGLEAASGRLSRSSAAASRGGQGLMMRDPSMLPGGGPASPGAIAELPAGWRVSQCTVVIVLGDCTRAVNPPLAVLQYTSLQLH